MLFNFVDQSYRIDLKNETKTETEIQIESIVYK